MQNTQIIEPDLTWIDGTFQAGVRVAIGDDGRISDVGDVPGEARRLRGRALLPGFVNAHSHAFQRGLRGRGERFPQGAGSFWTWREAMYDLVERLDDRGFYELTRRAFAEMLAAGITTVGEFHYLHHDAVERGFPFDELVLGAAADAGIRLVLLNAFYRTGGIDQPLAGGQRRFACHSPEEYWAQMDRLADLLGSGQTLGVVAHSIRAVPLDDIHALHEEAGRRMMVFHMHVEEQPGEIEQCLHAHGHTPMALLNRRLDIDPAFTAIHCTHTAAADLDDFLARGGNVCLCPLTEANLGDGLANVPAMLKRGGCICLGTDSNARIDMLEEMRLLEYGQRLASQTRGVCRDDAGRLGPVLLEMAAAHGARALGLRTGRLQPGHEADLVAVDLGHRSLEGCTPDTLADALVLGCDAGVVAEVCVGGRWIEAAAARGPVATG